MEKIINTITGNVVDNPDVTSVIEVAIDDNATDYEIEYETVAPYSEEVETSFGKEILIVGPDEVHYTKVVAFTELAEEVSSEKIKLYWVKNESAPLGVYPNGAQAPKYGVLGHSFCR